MSIDNTIDFLPYFYGCSSIDNEIFCLIIVFESIFTIIGDKYTFIRIINMKIKNIFFQNMFTKITDVI